MMTVANTGSKMMSPAASITPMHYRNLLFMSRQRCRNSVVVLSMSTGTDRLIGKTTKNQLKDLPCLDDWILAREVGSIHRKGVS